MVDAFREGLKDAGYVEGRNVAIEYRWANDHYDRVAAFVDDLVRRSVRHLGEHACQSRGKGHDQHDSHCLHNGRRSGAASTRQEFGPPRRQRHRRNPIERRTCAKADGTGASISAAATIIGLLIDPKSPFAETMTKNSEAAAETLGLELMILRASTEEELMTPLPPSKNTEVHSPLLVIRSSTTTSKNWLQLSIRHLVPTIYEYHPFAAAGGLAGYGGSISECDRSAGVYTGRILKGEKPADLPVQQSTKIELFINLKTAKLLGLTIPITLLGRADEVIE